MGMPVVLPYGALVVMNGTGVSLQGPHQRKKYYSYIAWSL